MPKMKIKRSDLESYMLSHPQATTQDVADHFGCRVASVWRAFKKYALPSHLHPMPYVKPKRQYNCAILADYLSLHPDATLREIADHFNMSITTAYIYRKSCGYRALPRYKYQCSDFSAYLSLHPDAKLKEIADHFNLTQVMARYVLKRCGFLESKPPKYQCSDFSAYLSLHPDAKLKEIADHFNLKEGTARYAFKKCGLPLPQSSRYKHPCSDIADYLSLHPDATYKEIADHFGFKNVSSSLDNLKRCGLPLKRSRKKA